MIVEPHELYARRAEQKEYLRGVELLKFRNQIAHPTEHPDGWDRAVMDFFIAQPHAILRIVTVANTLAKDFRTKCRKDRDRVRLLVMGTVGRLIQQARLKRVRRCFVRVNMAEISAPPIYPIGSRAPVAGENPARRRDGSTPTPMVIHPGIFV